MEARFWGDTFRFKLTLNQTKKTEEARIVAADQNSGVFNRQEIDNHLGGLIVAINVCVLETMQKSSIIHIA